MLFELDDAGVHRIRRWRTGTSHLEGYWYLDDDDDDDNDDDDLDGISTARRLYGYRCYNVWYH